MCWADADFLYRHAPAANKAIAVERSSIAAKVLAKRVSWDRVLMLKSMHQ